MSGQVQEPTQEHVKQACESFRRTFEVVRGEIGKVIVGHEKIVEGVLTALFAGGNVLLEGVPGLGKTLLVRTLADTLHLTFSRIQFTPDLMPADIIGTNIVSEDPATGRRTFVFEQGPIFAQIVLADEINRATPKTQSALLEAMQEHSVTVAGKTYTLEEPFFVLATQNPIEQEGTYPLPEAQMDRFLFKLTVGYSSMDELMTILDRTTSAEQPSAQRVLDANAILEAQKLIRNATVAPHVQRYAARLVLGTHPEGEHATELATRYLRCGASPRGAQALILGSKVLALADGRYHISHDDIDAIAKQTLRHRILLNFEAEADRVDPDDIIEHVIASTERVPVGIPG
jgi:MoxR-like ATPase